MAGNLNGQYRRPDRSEIGPYLRSLPAASGWPKNPPRLWIS